MVDRYLEELFGEEMLVPLKLVDEENVKWAIGVIIGNQISKIGLMNSGIKPTYYLCNEVVIRYTKGAHEELVVTEKDDDRVICGAVVFEYVS